MKIESVFEEQEKKWNKNDRYYFFGKRLDAPLEVFYVLKTDLDNFQKQWKFIKQESAMPHFEEILPG